MRKGDIDYILNQALEQVQAGADILDVNVGLPGIDEREMMITAVKSLQSVVDGPLQILQFLKCLRQHFVYTTVSR